MVCLVNNIYHRNHLARFSKSHTRWPSFRNERRSLYPTEKWLNETRNWYVELVSKSEIMSLSIKTKGKNNESHHFLNILLHFHSKTNDILVADFMGQFSVSVTSSNSILYIWMVNSISNNHIKLDKSLKWFVLQCDKFACSKPFR